MTTDNTNKEDWEVKFDSIFKDDLQYYVCCSGHECGCNGLTQEENLKIFIKSLLSTQEQKIRKDIIKLLPTKFKIECNHRFNSVCDKCDPDGMKEWFNMQIDNFATKLNNL